MNIECKVTEVKELGSHHMFLAEVQAVHVDQAYMTETGKFELNKTGLVAYSHGTYLETGKPIAHLVTACIKIKRILRIKRRKNNKRRLRDYRSCKRLFILYYRFSKGFTFIR